jgi:GxxExxY protein
MKQPLDQLIRQIVGVAPGIHPMLGPGLPESSYEACLAFELVERGIAFERQRELPLVYRGRTLDCGDHLDFLVAGSKIVESKSVGRLEPSISPSDLLLAPLRVRYRTIDKLQCQGG